MFVKSDQVSRDGAVKTQWRNPPDGYRLTAAQTDRLRRALRSNPLPEASAACLVPHHFFRFYDAQRREVGQISVCFCCLGVRGEPGLVPEGRELGADYAEIEKIVTELGASTRTSCGPSPSPE